MERLVLFGMSAFFMLLLVSACTAFKGKKKARVSAEKDSLKTDFYQNLTSKFNILYNANLMLDQERKAIYDGAGKNYQVRLSVFDEPSANGDPHQAMDSLVQKAYKIVNTKQESKYVGEAYFIIGKAYYLKGSYYTAVEFFDKLIKDEEMPAKYKPLGYAWKSRALLQINKGDLASKVVDSAFMYLDKSQKTRTFVNAAQANVLIRQGKALEAIPFLEYALESNKDSFDRGRWRFLLAQLYRDNKQLDEARALFTKRSNSNVPFDMAFEAGLQAAFLIGEQSGGALADRVKPFQRMLREGKHEGYKDQILYEIGKIYLDAKDEANAIKFFNLSLIEPNRSAYQATETYLTFADHFFDQEKYAMAQNYFDTTATVLPNDYTDVNKVRRKLAYMGELTNLYEVNLWQDTLISLGKLSEEQRDEEVSKFAGAQLIAQQKLMEQQEFSAKRNKKKGNATQVVYNNAFANTTALPTGDSFSGAKFYFNNPDALMLGASEFKRKWGNRQLRDDWRFAGDDTPTLTAQTNRGSADDDKLVKVDSFDAVAFLTRAKQRYLDSIPRSQEDYDARQRVVHDNMIVIGNIYRDYTRDNHDAIKAYEAFLARFPNTPAGAEIYYSLYRMYDGIDATKSLAYKNRLITLFPTTLHAMVAQDPYYMDKVNRDKRVLDRAFDRLFTLYTNGDHVAVIKQANEELQGNFQTTGMVAQIEYLKALAIGRVGRVSDFTNALTSIVEKYPQDSLVVPLAVENLAFIDSNPGLFINRVNALQDIDKKRIAFVDEPHMTPWPALNIDGDYRTGIAIVKEEPKKEEEKIAELPKKEEPKQTEAERKEIELLLAAEPKAKPKVTIDTKEIGQGVTIAKREDNKAVAKLTIEEEIEEEKRKVASLEAVGVSSAGLAGAKVDVANAGKLNVKAFETGDLKINYGPNEYRDKKLFPDTATYYFTINVKDPKVNLAPSRYGIGQFNRSRYARANINHQLKLVNAENQLLFIGPFETFEEVKTYESRILPLLAEVMKVPQEDYNSFIITKEVIGTLTDGIQISNFHQIYIEQ